MSTAPKTPRSWRRALVVALLLFMPAGGLAWWYLLRSPQTTAAAAAPQRLSPLDALDPEGLSDSAWPRKSRPKEAVGVLTFERDAAPLQVEVKEDVIFFRDTDGKEVGKIDGYAPPKPPPSAPIMFNGQQINMPTFAPLSYGPQTHVTRAVLSPTGNRLVVFGRTSAGVLESGSPDAFWLQVWVSDGTGLKPLEAQPMEGNPNCVGDFSQDGTLLAMNTGSKTEICQVSAEGMKPLWKISVLEAKAFAFSPDNRQLAVVRSDHLGVYDFDSVRPDGGGQMFRRKVGYVLLLFVAAAAVLGLAFAFVGRLDTRALETSAQQSQPPQPAPATSESPVLSPCIGCFGTGSLSVPLAVSETLKGGVLLLPCFFCGGSGKFKVTTSSTPSEPAENPARAVRPRSRRLRWLGIAVGVAGLGGLVCLVWWGWLIAFSAPDLRTPSGSALANTTATAVCFSPDGRSLAAVLKSGELAAFDAATGEETGRWSMPEKVTRPEYAPDGRHLLGMTDRKAYVLRLKPFDEAAWMLACCEAELKDNPGSTDALMARGQVYRRQGRHDKALADLDEVIRRDAANALAWYQRGLARADAGDMAGARADLAEALRLDPRLDSEIKH